MVRQKIILGNYIYIVELYRAEEDLLSTPVRKKFFVLRDQDYMSGVTIDKNVYFIEQASYETNKTIYPVDKNTLSGYSTNPNEFSINITNENISKYLDKLYDSNGNEISIPCDKVRIYFPTIKNTIQGIVDIENFINDIKFHYLINDISNYKRYSETEFSVDHQSYSEYIDIYVPSMYYLLFSDSSIYINDYNVCQLSSGESLNVKTTIPFNTLYYPFEIITVNTTTPPTHIKVYHKTSKFATTQFYNTLNVMIYPYSDIDVNDIFVSDSNILANSAIFNIPVNAKLSTNIRFSLPGDFDNDEDRERFYGLPCMIAEFSFPKFSESSTLLDSYLSLNTLTLEDYFDFDDNYDIDDDLFGEELSNIKKTGFFIEMATDRNFTNTFFKYIVNITDDENIIDNLVFPLNGFFSDWNDVPELILYRITFIDKVASIKMTSNTAILTDEWYKYLTNKDYKNKLKLTKIYKCRDMVITDINPQDAVFIDKINCTVVKSGEDGNTYNITKKNNPKVIYKPVFYRTQPLQQINIKAGVSQNIGINLDEYLSKVETFKLIIDQVEYIETGRNNMFVIFNVNATKFTTNSGSYIITNEDNEYISDGTYSVS